MNRMRADPDRLAVNCNPTAKSLPIRAGLRQGLFEARGIDLVLVSTADSRAQREGLARGEFHVVHVAVDNAVSMRDVDGLDVVVIMGGDSGMNELFVQPHIRAVEDLRGGRLIVDAPDTAFALQAYRILGDHALQRDRDYTVVAVGRGEFRLEAMRNDTANSASILNPPYSLTARRMGLRSFGDTTALIGPYQAGSAFAMRQWAQAHRDVVVRYIAAYLECLDLVLAPSRHDLCVGILEEELLLPHDIASESVALLRQAGFGLEPNAAIDLAGFRNTLALRAMTEGGAPEADPQSYLDLSYHAAALRLVAGPDRAAAAPATGVQ
jgi:ABC-type nitrate/sulfonate/bicarbonate transport system substrate-binding protein